MLDVPPRVERKFIVPAGAAQAVLAWLEHSCVPDPSYPRGVVSTIYFDTPELDAYDEKRDGDFLKRKLRLRWYGPVGGEPAEDPEGEVECFLESKWREGASGGKSRVAVAIRAGVLAARPLESPEIEELPSRHPGLAGRAGALAPLVLVRYERRRFVEPRCSARVSLDTDIRCVAVNQSRLAAFAPEALAVDVLEAKTLRGEGLGFLGPLAGVLTATSFSKYARCLRLALAPGDGNGEER
jgi:hypothetical protein